VPTVAVGAPLTLSSWWAPTGVGGPAPVAPDGWILSPALTSYWPAMGLPSTPQLAAVPRRADVEGDVLRGLEPPALCRSSI
jgi:hypothetical protein